jgi:hypothetical protein
LKKSGLPTFTILAALIATKTYNACSTANRSDSSLDRLQAAQTSAEVTDLLPPIRFTK